MKRLWNNWKTLARMAGDFQTRLILGYFYFLIVTPFALLTRLFGDPFTLRAGKQQSFWVERETIETGLQEAKMQS